MHQHVRHSSTVYIMAAVVLLAVPSVVRATNYIWTRGGGDTNWSTTANWTPTGSPSIASDGAAVTNNLTANLGILTPGATGAIVGALTLGDADASHVYTLTGPQGAGALKFDNGAADATVTGSGGANRIYYPVFGGTKRVEVRGSTYLQWVLRTNTTTTAGTFVMKDANPVFDHLGATPANPAGNAASTYKVDFEDKPGVYKLSSQGSDSQIVDLAGSGGITFDTRGNYQKIQNAVWAFTGGCKWQGGASVDLHQTGPSISNNVLEVVSPTHLGLNQNTSQTVKGLTGTGSIGQGTQVASTPTFQNLKTWTVDANTATSYTFSGPVSGAYTKFLKKGAGTQVLTGTNTHERGTFVEAGTLTLNGSLSEAEVTVSGGVMNGIGTVHFKISGTTNDTVVVKGGELDLRQLTLDIDPSGLGVTERSYVVVDYTAGGTVTTSSSAFAGVLDLPSGYALLNQTGLRKIVMAKQDSTTILVR